MSVLQAMNVVAASLHNLGPADVSAEILFEVTDERPVCQ